MISPEYCFAFLRLAMGGIEHLPFTPSSEKDWLCLFEFCKKQALLGIGFYAVEQLYAHGIECPSSLRLKWMVLTLQIEKRNKLINEQCKELQEQIQRDGIQCCILKGQGNLLNYSEALKLKRQSGDIDIWCIDNGYKSVIKYVRNLHRINDNKAKAKIRYHHIQAPLMNGTEIEVHYRPSYSHSIVRNIRMQRWFNEQANVCMRNKTYLGFTVPTASVNVVYQICHMFSHYFESGLGLRQLMDYYFALKKWHEQVKCVESGMWSDGRQKKQSQGMWSEGLGTSAMSKEEVMRVLCSFGMGKFAAAVMWVLHEVFAMPTHYYICEPNEKEGQKLLAEIMQGGNFGQYDEHEKDMKNGGTILHAIWKLKRVMRLVSSYPEEALCEPFFRVWHLIWRITTQMIQN